MCVCACQSYLRPPVFFFLHIQNFNCTVFPMHVCRSCLILNSKFQWHRSRQGINLRNEFKKHKGGATVCRRSPPRPVIATLNKKRGCMSTAFVLNMWRFSSHCFRALRYTAYRLFVWWVWSRLGKGNRQPLPGCVLRKIRSTFPSGNYEMFSWI